MAESHSLHEKENTLSILKNIAGELRQNKKAIGEMKEYNSLVITKIDSALTNKRFQDNLDSNDEFHLKIICSRFL